MSWWEAIILGLVQGITEFLPVSSSGHLTLIGGFLGIEESQALFFFVMLHVGTLAAVVLALWKNIVSLVKWPVKKEVWLLIVATVPAGLAGLFLSKFIEKLFGGDWLWLCFAITAILLILTEFIIKRKAKLKAAEDGNATEGVIDGIKATTETDGTMGNAEDNRVNVSEKENNGESAKGKAITLKQAIGMGCAQAVAVIPGISRSGSTICAGLLLGADKKEVSSFSFLMSIPIILASALLEFLKIDSFTSVNFFYIALGMCAAFVSGYFSVTFMLKIIAKSNYKWFSLYLIVLSIATLIIQLTA